MKVNSKTAQKCGQTNLILILIIFEFLFFINVRQLSQAGKGG